MKMLSLSSYFTPSTASEHVYACYADDGSGNDYYMRRICYARWSIMTI
jgi:hypothetical protein